MDHVILTFRTLSLWFCVLILEDCESEITKFHVVILIKENITWFEISMN